MSLDRIVHHLTKLVACNTQNPPREINADSEIFHYCNAVVGDAFSVREWDYGNGHVSWFAEKGAPKVLFNVHLDTVPFGDGWSNDPLELLLKDGRAYGRGACDIKGAAAVLLALVEQGVNDLALLFTTDEEGAGSCCVSRFLETIEKDRFEHVIVAEPTLSKPVFAHRGFLSVKTRFFGRPGHSSEARALTDNANHQMAQWAAAAVEVARQQKSADHDPGACFNIGLVDGGTKSNVIAGESFVHWSARLKPGQSNDEFLGKIQACVPSGARAEWEVPFAGEPLPAFGRRSDSAEQFCVRSGLDAGPPVDFWTEAALFSAAGFPAVVLGPGDIAQAHATDEWVALSQLEKAQECYTKVLKN